MNCGKRATQIFEPVTPERTEVCTLTVCAAQPPKLQFSQTTSRGGRRDLPACLMNRFELISRSSRRPHEIVQLAEGDPRPAEHLDPVLVEVGRLGETADAAAADDQVVDALGHLDPVARALDDDELADASRAARPQVHGVLALAAADLHLHEVEVDLLPAGPGVVGPHLVLPEAERGGGEQDDHFAATAGFTRSRSSSRSSAPAADRQKMTP